MASINTCAFSGRLGKDPEVSYTSAGLAVARLSLAVNGREKKGNEWVDRTDWANLVAFGKLAELIGERLKRGDHITTACQYRVNKYQAKDGSDRYSHSFIVSTIDLPPMPNKSAPMQPQTEYQPGQSSDFPDDDIPF